MEMKTSVALMSMRTIKVRRRIIRVLEERACHRYGNNHPPSVCCEVQPLKHQPMSDDCGFGIESEGRADEIVSRYQDESRQFISSRNWSRASYGSSRRSASPMPLRDAAAKCGPCLICRPPAPQAGRRGDVLVPAVSRKRVGFGLAPKILQATRIQKSLRMVPLRRTPGG
jgi:hypothetical protein